MHPPDLNMLETNSGLRGSDGSFGGKAHATNSNITLDEDDDFEGCPPKARRGGRSDRNSYERFGWRGGRGQGSGKPASGRGQRSRTTGGSSSSKNRSNMRHYIELTDDQRDFLCTSRIIDVAYTEETDISLGVDVVHATPAKDRNQPNHEENFVYRRMSESTSGTLRCALTFETGTVEIVDVVAVTPPQQNKKHNRVIEDDDEFVDPPQTEFAKSTKTRHLKDTGESDDVVLVTPPKQYTKHNRVIEADDEFVNPPLTETAKQYNKHNRVIEADDDFVDPPVIQTTEFDGGESFTPRKHILSTFVFKDDDLFVDPPVTEGIGVQGGEAFMKGIQVSEMYGYDDVVHVFNNMEGSGFQPQDIDYSKEDSDIYMLGLPCRHAIAASSYRNMEYNFFVSQYHVKDTWSETVKGIILPVPNPEDIHIPADILKLQLFPPMIKRTKGRLCIKRKQSAGEVPDMLGGTHYLELIVFWNYD
ncbi:hypothetical protein IGI04_035753 [Brassica rapa subsp. trilocularis]|uniref:Uncharacterized protein n=1 Tax=Brassica rapa subsp. trilocularis TaxID=1813537 RepID=A0ABQ7LFL5_BRACM|nr:hypothetical protein IGI04_035753 [Brassica rapa subsp. trilocularis]